VTWKDQVTEREKEEGKHKQARNNMRLYFFVRSFWSLLFVGVK